MNPELEAVAAGMRRENRTPKSKSGLRARRQKVALEMRASVHNLTTEQVAKVSRASLRQLQYWDEQRMVMVHHKDGSRVYTPADTAKVTAIAKLRKREIKLGLASKLATYHAFAVDSICDAIDLLKRYGIGIR